MSALIERRSDAELAALMGNLGGHDLPSLLDAFAAARTHDRPVCFICYTIKGFGLPLAGHKDNHAGLMNPAQVETLRAAMGVRPATSGTCSRASTPRPSGWRRSCPPCRSQRTAARGATGRAIPVPDALRRPCRPGAEQSTQHGFGLLMHELAKGDTARWPGASSPPPRT